MKEEVFVSDERTDESRTEEMGGAVMHAAWGGWWATARWWYTYRRCSSIPPIRDRALAPP